MDIDNKPVIWLVGASTGIGYELAHTLAAQAHTLILSARTDSKLQALAHQLQTNHPKLKLQVLAFDLTDEAQRTAALSQVTELDWLILNACTCEYVDMTLEQTDMSLYERVLNTNVLAPIALFHAIWPLLRRSKQPRLIGISSSVTFSPLPRAQAYGASKAAFSYWLLSMATDLKPQGVLVQLVSPGFVDTPLTQQNDFKMPFLLSAKQAAQRIQKGLERRQVHIKFPYRFTFWLQFFGMLPLSWQVAINSQLSRSRKHIRGSSPKQ
jgi:short-subunit dehydrogenase